jgi:transmembrane sensor
MTRIVEFPDRRVIADEAIAWLIRLDADRPPTKEELRELGEWLRRSPVHRAELRRVAGLWGRMNVLTNLAVPLGTVRRTASSGRLRRVLDRAPLRACAGWVAVAAAAVLAVALLHQVLLQRVDNTNGFYATAIGQRRTVRLSDGSQILLNTNTQVKVSYEEDYRRVYLLQGEALFSVAKDADRPFRVYAGSGRIEAVGTAFSVYLNGSSVRVAVTEGRVALASTAGRDGSALPTESEPTHEEHSGSSLDDHMYPLGIVDAWQVATIQADRAANLEAALALESIQPVAPDELQDQLAWREGMLVFSGETLEEVVKEFSRYTTVVIEVADPLVRNIQVGGRFPVGETDTLLAMLETNFNLRVTRVGPDHVILSAAK